MLLVGMKIVTVEQMIKENNSQIANLTNYSNQIIVVLINYSFNKCICQRLDDQTFLETSLWLHFPEIVVTLELLHSIQWHQQHWSLGIVPQGSLSSFVVSIECVPSLICCQV